MCAPYLVDFAEQLSFGIPAESWRASRRAALHFFAFINYLFVNG
jgi:hypothetical protein